jgi:16S rRNA (uracil1498-N3)-methyltransferase
LNTDEGAASRAAAAAQVFVEDLELLLPSEADAHHLFRVRRLHERELVIASDGAGSWRRCRIAEGRLVGEGELVFERKPSPARCVAFAPVKGERSEWAVAKLTELGCDRIVALATERAAVRWSGSTGSRALERWRRVSREAAAQCRRVWLPEIAGPLPVSHFAGEASAAMGVPGGPPLQAASSTILIGPEGGWSEAERSLGLATVGLGPNVLRTETAALAAGVLGAAIRQGTVAAVELVRRQKR